MSVSWEVKLVSSLREFGVKNFERLSGAGGHGQVIEVGRSSECVAKYRSRTARKVQSSSKDSQCLPFAAIFERLIISGWPSRARSASDLDDLTGCRTSHFRGYLEIGA